MIVCVVMSSVNIFAHSTTFFLLQKTLVSAQFHDSLGQAVSHPLALDKEKSVYIVARTDAGVADRWPGEAGRGGVEKDDVKGWDGVGTIAVSINSE